MEFYNPYLYKWMLPITYVRLLFNQKELTKTSIYHICPLLEKNGYLKHNRDYKNYVSQLS